MIHVPSFIRKEIHENDWLGVITNNKDPLFSGRCQVRVFNLLDTIEDDLLPWAVPINSTIFGGNGAGSISVPKVGQFVRINFSNGDVYALEYTTIQNIDSALIEEIKNDYEGTHVILYDPDQELNVIFQPNRGLQLFFKGSYIQISPDSMITIQHSNQDSMIQLDGDKCNVVTKNEINISAAAKVDITADEVVAAGNNTTKIGAAPYYHSLLAEPLFALLSVIASTLDAKLPATPGVTTALVEQAKQAATSTNVLIGK